MKIVYHTKITVETIAKNGSERLGAKAKCKCRESMERNAFEMDVEMNGKTKKEAKDKLIAFLKSENNVLRTYTAK